ncbi:multidrug resistance-associated protein 1-like [Planococcus citri]|uniref:multidrug resistance-associated protein 1-like n=1 Tax=Planococcus citri TaxID=170843 RepID=UPI0031F73234
MMFNITCGSPLWDLDKLWYTNNPDFTQCFKDTVLIWIPSIYLWLLAPLEYHYLRKSASPKISLNAYNCFKLSGIIMMIFISLIQIVGNENENRHNLIANQKPTVQFLSYVLFLSLTWANIRMGIRSSGILFGYSALLVLCGFPEFRSTLNHNRVQYMEYVHLIVLQFNYHTLHWITAVIVLLTNCFADRRPENVKRSEEDVCPEKHASFLSKLYLCWFNKYIWWSNKTPVTGNLWDMDEEYTAAYNSPMFEETWTKCHQPKKSYYDIDDDIDSEKSTKIKPKGATKSIISPLINLYYKPFLVCVFWRFVDTLLNLSFPMIFSCFITCIQQKDPAWKAYLFVLLFILNSLTQTVIMAKFFCGITQVQMRVKSALMSTIYKKTLRLSSRARRQYTSGDLVNLMLIDVNRVVNIIYYMNNIWVIPLQIVLTFYFVGKSLGPSIIPGLMVVLALIPINYLIAKLKKKMQLQEMFHRDKCVKFIQDLLSGIKVLKMYGWEPSFEEEASRLRSCEIKLLKMYGYLHGILQFICACVPILVSAVVFATYVISSADNVLDIKKAFVTISFFNTLRIPLETIPSLLSNIMQAIVSATRLNEFMNLDDLDPNAITHEELGKAIIVERGEFSWTEDEGLSTLRNINLKINPGELVSVIGSVGAGKSSLIAALLGEIHKVSGNINIQGTTAYVPQQAWIFNSTVKENITMGRPVDETLYQKALRACALRTDLANMAYGDMTEIGEKGVNLSGGQKQRISLARAVCFDADIYYLDDPLSAVDYNVAKHIFNNVLGPEGLLKNKTRIIVTHNITFLSRSDLILLLEDGKIAESGSYKELIDRNDRFADFLRTCSKDNEIKDDISVEKSEKRNPEIKEPSMDRELGTTKIDPDGDSSRSKLIEKEYLQTGTVNKKIYAFYLTALGTSLAFTIMLIFTIYQCFAMLTNIWLSLWARKNQDCEIDQKHDRFFYLSVYAALGLGEAISSLIGNVTLFVGILKASTVLYNKLLTSVLKWPMRIFDSTPIGRITNRFTIDIYSLDYEVGPKTASILALIQRFIAIFIVIIYTTPVCAFIIAPVLSAMYIVQKFYVKLSLQLKRIDSINKSPMSSHYLETISGLQSIRAYGLQDKFIEQSYHKIDLHSATQYIIIVCSRWLCIRVDILGGIIVFFATFFMVQQRDILQTGLIAFATSYAIQITKELSWLLMYSVDVQNSLVSVERVKEFMEYPQESQCDIENIIPTEWPEKGEIVFQDYNLQYREGLDLVLRGLNFTIKSGEKVGIVGRTGAGKSSLISALFRITEPHSGKILIDDIDICTIGLHSLRSRLTVIPQDPVLFISTLRFNLDPTNDHSDDEIWNALEKAHLKQYVSCLPNGLYSDIEESGGNLSFGQRQLICLARALLRKTKILILDEATASVDLETDKLIQETICTEFADCTVMTIAHRLNTIQNYDKIMVLDKGSIVEFDSPDNLFKSDNSIFQQMASDAGLI